MKSGEMTVHFDIDPTIHKDNVVIWIEAGVFEVRAARQLEPEEVVRKLNAWAARGGMLGGKK